MNLEERNKKVEENLKLVSHSLSLLKVPWNEDYFQQGVLELIRCVENYDETKGCKFSTYAVKCITLKLKDYIKRDYVIKPKLTGEKGGKVWAPQVISLSRPVVTIPGNKELSVEDVIGMEESHEYLYLMMDLQRLVEDGLLDARDLQLFLDSEVNGYNRTDLRRKYEISNTRISVIITEVRNIIKQNLSYNYFEGGR